MNHSTVLRRVANLEGHLGARLFEKLPSGYTLTIAGEEILDLAVSMEDQSSLLRTRVFARDQQLTGPLRIALPPSLATDLLMPDLAEFTQLHPEIELQVVSSYDTVNLTTRQADLAIRLVYDQMNLPQHLFGVRLQAIHRSVYLSRDLDHRIRTGSLTSVSWVLKEEDGDVPAWAAKVTAPIRTPGYKVSDPSAQLAAVRANMGLTILPCFIGDADPTLTRAQGCKTEHYGRLWILTHGDTRKTKRIRVFSDFIKQRIKSHSELLVGGALSECPV